MTERPERAEPVPQRLLPSWLWAPAYGRIVSANRAALVFWDETSVLALADRRFAKDESFPQAARRVAESGRPERMRLSFAGAREPGPFQCLLRPAHAPDGEPGVLISLEPPTAPRLPPDGTKARLTAALQHLPYPVLLARADGTLVSANISARESLGESGADLTARLGETAARILSEGLTHQGWVSRSVGVGPDAWPYHAEARRVNDPVDGAPIDVIVLRDIVGVFAAESQLTAERRELAALVQTSCDFLWRTDANGRLTVLSPGFERTTGVAATTLLGQSWEDLGPRVSFNGGPFAPETGHVQARQVCVTSDAGQASTLMLLAQRRLDKAARFRGFLGVGRALGDTEKLPAAPVIALGDASEEALLALDRAARIRDVNQAATALLQAPAERLIGLSLADLLTAEGRNALAGAHGPVEIAAKLPAGGTLRVRAAFRPLPHSGCAALALSDPSHPSVAEVSLRRALDEAQAANRQKSEFLAKVSHELRTPLNAIIGFAEIMRDERLGTLGNARYAGYVRDIHHSGQLLLSLINDLLDLSKIEAGRAELRTETVDIGAIIERAVGLLKPAAANAAVSLAAHVPDHLPAVLADDRSLEQILLNLISNAVKFTEPGGRVLVTAENDAKGGITVGVRDTGVGMSDAELKVALEPFRRVERVGGLERPGTGLGLPLAKALAEANDAEFHIASAPKAGTSIEIRFPRERLAE